MSSSQRSSNLLHVAMFPFLAAGHQIAFLQLSNKLAQRGHRVSFLLTNKTKLKFESYNLYPNLITFIPLAVPHIDGLPLGTETMADVSRSMAPLFLNVIDKMSIQVEPVLRDLKPNIVFYDFFHWIPSLARPLGVKSILYSTLDALTVAYLFLPIRELQLPKGEDLDETQLLQPPPGFPDSSIYLHLHEARGSLDYYKDFASGMTTLEFARKCLKECDAWCFRTCREIDGAFSDCLETHYKKQIVLAGPVIDFPPSSSILEERWISWLDGFKTGSVVYCAFGSECVLEKDKLQELLLGFEMTGLPFLVALKPPFGAESVEEALPEGFQERVKGRGMVYGGWVQQQLILRHPSVGCFISHCGAASIWEALVNDCQLVLLPQGGEQFLSARRISTYLNAGVEIERREEDGWFNRESVLKAIKMVMDEDSKVGTEFSEKSDVFS
ncbi:hypothetical protein IFM89_010833 [Coptis chinensis]|uniref:Glycosyltransferase n=1 Tax=Coptis chinensis TaxID=261450 RepID=A0A835HZS5_9MAGN|nr:hypothetical protein IFM89_010833 [Coptis chinensis]